MMKIMTRKQLFHRQMLSHNNDNKDRKDAAARERRETVTIGRSFSHPNVQVSNNPIDNSLVIAKAWRSDDNITCNKLKKNVSFSIAVQVVLIPCREEYRQSNLDENIWWNGEEIANFKKSAISDIRHIISNDTMISPKMAMDMLCQPSYIPLNKIALANEVEEKELIG